MKRETGQILRGVGLAVETVCLLAFVAVRRGNSAGFDVRGALGVGVALGVVLWMAGLVVIWTASRRPRQGD